MAIKTALLIPDTHRPYHHRKAYQLMISIARAVRPDQIIIKGDYADFYAVQQHGPRSPGLLHDLQEEINDVNAGLDELDKLFPKAEKIYLEGNHEFRLERYLVQNALPLHGLYSVDLLFKMKERGWKWIPYDMNQRFPVLGSNLYARHEPFATTPANSIRKALCSHTYGHIHRIEEAHAVSLDQKHFTAFSDGWLGDSRFDVFKYMKNTPQWQLGFSVVTYAIKTKAWHHQIIKIQEVGTNRYQAIYQGQVFEV